MGFCGGSVPCSQAINVARLIPSNAAVRRSFSFDSLLYRPNAFKTSSVVISAGRFLKKLVPSQFVRKDRFGSRKTGNCSIAAELLLSAVPWAHLFACKEKFRIAYSRIDQPRVIPVHTKVRESIFKLGRNVIDLLSREGWFNTVGKIFFNS